MNSNVILVILSLFVLFLGCVGQGPASNTALSTTEMQTQNGGNKNTGTTAGSNLKTVPSYDGSYIQGVFQREGVGTGPEWITFSFPDWVIFEKPATYQEYPYSGGIYAHILDPTQSDTYPYYYLEIGGNPNLTIYSLTGEETKYAFAMTDEDTITLNGQSYKRVFAPHSYPPVNPNANADSGAETDGAYDESGYGLDGYGMGEYDSQTNGAGGNGFAGQSVDYSQSLSAVGSAFPSATTIVGAFVSANSGWVIFDAYGTALFGGWDGQPLANGLPPGKRTYSIMGNQITYNYTQYDGTPVVTTKTFEITNDGTNGPASFSENGTTYTRVDYPLTGLSLQGKYYNYNVSQYGYPSAYGDSYSSTSTSKTYYTFSSDGSVVREGAGTFSSTDVQKDEYGTGTNQDIYGNYYDKQTTNSGAAGGNSKSGTYSIQGNQITFNYSDGSTETKMIALSQLSDMQSGSIGMIYLNDLPFVKAE